MKTDTSEMLVIKLYLFEIKSHLIPTLPPPTPFHRAGANLISGEIISILSPSISRVTYVFLLRKGAENQSPRLHRGLMLPGALEFRSMLEERKEKSCLRLEFRCSPHFIASERK